MSFPSTFPLPPAPSEGREDAEVGGLLFPLPFLSPFSAESGLEEGSPLSFRDLKGPVQLSTKGADKK